MKIKLDIIMPVYHEEKNIEKVIIGIEKYVKTSHRILLIFQDKNDPTIKIAKKIQKNIKCVKIVFTRDGKGLIKAYKTGFRICKADIIVIMMSDLCDNPRDIDKMVIKIDNGADIVCASRNYKNGKRYGGAFIKTQLSAIAGKSLKKLFGFPTSDALNAFKAFKCSIISEITLESKEGFVVPFELTVKANKLKKRIEDIPTVWKDRESGTSKFRLLNAIPHYLYWYFYAIKK